jgi:calcineurin-like phosphoesterase
MTHLQRLKVSGNALQTSGAGGWRQQASKRLCELRTVTLRPYNFEVDGMH